jgi:hypothetical protein
MVLTVITPEPPPLRVRAPSDEIPTLTVRSELPVPLVIVPPAEAMVIADTKRSVVDPKEIVVVPEAETTPKLCALPASVDAAALKVNDPASMVFALTCPEPAPKVIETESPEISWRTAVSPLPNALVRDNAPTVFKLDAIIEPLPAILTVKLAEAVTLFKVTSLY